MKTTIGLRLEDWELDMFKVAEVENKVARVRELILKGYLYELQEERQLQKLESKKPLIGGRLETSCSI